MSNFRKIIKWVEVIACFILIVASIIFASKGNNIIAIYCLLWAIFLKLDKDIF